MLLAFLAAWTTARPLASPSRQSVTTASKTLFWSFSIASRAEVEGVTVWPAASRMAHFSLTTEGSSSTQRILAIRRPSTPRRRIRAPAEVGCGKKGQPRAALFSSRGCAKSNLARFIHGTGVADLLRHRLGLCKQQQVVGTPRF